MKPQGAKAIRLPLTQKLVILVGLSVLALLISLPVSDSAILLNDFNYTYWDGQTLPITVILALVTVVLIYFAMSGQGMDNYTMHHLATLVSTFCTLLGIVLVLSSMFLYYRAEYISSSITYNCKGSLLTRDIGRYYEGLLALRQSPACAKQWSIQSCAGYEQAAPYAASTYLQELEMNYHCSGFCTASRGNASLIEIAAASPSSGQSSSSFLSRGSEELEQMGVKNAAKRLGRSSSLPPALFSQSVYKTSCDGAAARNLTTLGGDISKVWWWMSIVLFGLGAFVSLTEWLCKPK